GGQHSGHTPLRLIERVRYGCVPILGPPLFRSRRTACQLPLVFEQVLEEQVAPLCWRLRPSNFWTAGDGIGSDSCAELAFPPESLVLQGAAFRLRPHQR